MAQPTLDLRLAVLPKKVRRQFLLEVEVCDDCGGDMHMSQWPPGDFTMWCDDCAGNHVRRVRPERRIVHSHVGPCVIDV